MEILFAGMEEVLEEINAVAANDTTLLLTGETGTVILSKGEELDMTKVLVSDRPQKERFSGKLVDMEKRAIEDALEQTGGNRKQASEILDISLRTLQYKIKEYGINK